MCFRRRFVLSDKRKKICDSVWTGAIYYYYLKKMFGGLSGLADFLPKKNCYF